MALRIGLARSCRLAVGIGNTPCSFSRSQFLRFTAPPALQVFTIKKLSIVTRSYATVEQPQTAVEAMAHVTKLVHAPHAERGATTQRPSIFCMRFDASGCHEKAYSKHELMAELKVPPRDLRIIVSSTGAGSSLVVRDKAIIVNLVGVKAVIEWDHVLLFDYQRSEMRRVKERLESVTYRYQKPRFNIGAPRMLAGFSAAPGGAVPQGTPGASRPAELHQAVPSYGRRGQSPTPTLGPQSATPDASFPPTLSSASAHADFAHALDPPDSPAQNVGESFGMAPMLPGASGRSEIDEGMPFEFRALEAILIEVVADINEKFSASQRQITRHLDLIQRNIEPPSVELLIARKGLNGIEKSIQQCNQALHEVLASNEDMAGMYLTVRALTNHKRRVDLHEEIETLLETYIRELERIGGDLSNLKQSIENTEDHYQLTLDTMRNEIMTLSLLMTVGSFSTTVAALSFAAFGMNLPTGLEADPRAFVGIASASVIASAGLFWSIFRYLRSRSIVVLRAKKKAKVPVEPPPAAIKSTGWRWIGRGD